MPCSECFVCSAGKHGEAGRVADGTACLFCYHSSIVADGGGCWDEGGSAVCQYSRYTLLPAICLPPDAPQANLRSIEHQGQDRTCSVFFLFIFLSLSHAPAMPASLHSYEEIELNLITSYNNVLETDMNTRHSSFNVIFRKLIWHLVET